MKKIIFLIALSFAATSISNEYNAEENAKCYTGNKTTSPIADQADAEVKCVAACSVVGGYWTGYWKSTTTQGTCRCRIC
jgi:hypothetical protein